MQWPLFWWCLNWFGPAQADGSSKNKLKICLTLRIAHNQTAQNMRGFKKLYEPRNKNNEHILVFGKTSVGGSLTTTRLWNCLSVPCCSFWMWSVHRSAALLHTWPDCLVHWGPFAVLYWCWKPQTPGLRVDTFCLPQAGKLHISFPKKKKSTEYRREVWLPWLTDSEKEWKQEDVSSMKWNRITVKCSLAWWESHTTFRNKLRGETEARRNWFSTGFPTVDVAYINKQWFSCVAFHNSSQILASPVLKCEFLNAAVKVCEYLLFLVRPLSVHTLQRD